MAKEEALEYKCPSCCATIAFNPKLGKWKCDYCGSQFTLEEINQKNKKSSIKKANIADILHNKGVSI